MNKYIYVVALMDSKNAAEMHDSHDMIGFKHAFVEAESVDLAYDAGFKEVELSPTETRHNDYVVKLP